jgi:glutamate 5-kinase
MILVAKIGTSSLTGDDGGLETAAITKLTNEVAQARGAGHQVVIVTSAAISSGLPLLGFAGDRPRDTLTLQAAAAVGQSRLQRAWDEGLQANGLLSAQVLLTPNDFFHRRQYLHARQTIERLLQLGVVPVINENDAIADDEIRFGDNDRIAALVAHAVGAELLVLLTDQPGLFTADPRLDESASLVEDVIAVDKQLEVAAGGAGTRRGSGGMSAKLTAARMAAWTGVRAVIAAAQREDVLRDAIAGTPGVGTIVHPHNQKLSARKLWIAFAMPAGGRIVVDDGARKALTAGNRSLLPAGVVGVEGEFDADTGVEILDTSGEVFAKGVTHYDAPALREALGRRTADLPDGVPHEVVHRDDLVVLVD